MKIMKRVISAVTLISMLAAQLPVLPVHASGAVSYINYPLATSSVPLEPVVDDIEIEIVPSDKLEIEAEVLAAQNPQSECSGSAMTEGGFVCSNFSVEENVTGSLVGNTFSRSCRIDVAIATYPKFFRGGDFNEDGRIDLYKGEWPSFSDATGQLQPDGEFVQNGEKVEILPGDEYHYSMAVNYIPDGNVEPSTDGSEPTAAKYKPQVTGAGSSIDQQASTSNESESYLAFPQGGCDGSPLDTIATQCESGRKSFNEWSAWSNPQGVDDSSSEEDARSSTEVAGVSTECIIVNGQSNCGISFWYPDNGKKLARESSEVSTCPSVNVVPNKLACINASALAFGWVFSFSGFLQNIGCRLRGNCYENVQVMMNVESLFGSNQGCEEPCGDVYSDTLIASQNPPSSFDECKNAGTGQNSPCWPDSYVGTEGFCRVCGKLTSCTFVWKNWVRDNYLRQRTENGPCEKDDQITYNGVTYSMCDVDQYVDYVIERSASM